MDSLDRVHISYLYDYDTGSGWEGDLYYITQDGSGWKAPEQVDDCGGNWCGNWSDLALDSMDRPHISYNDYDDGLLMYAYWDGTAWQKTMVDDCGGTDYCGKSTSIALTKAGKPYISYRDGGWNDGSPSGTATLRYACLSGSTWQKTEIDTRIGGGDTSLALDSSGTPHITYWEGFYKAPKYATTHVVNGTTYWSTVFVEDRRTLYYYLYDPDWEEQGPKIGQNNAIAVDHMGRVQIVYSHQATNGIKHAGTLRGPYFPWILFTATDHRYGNDTADSVNILSVQYCPGMQLPAITAAGISGGCFLLSSQGLISTCPFLFDIYPQYHLNII